MAYRHRRPFRRYRRRYRRWRGRRGPPPTYLETFPPLRLEEEVETSQTRICCCKDHQTQKHKYITVTGWEPLGNCCVTDSAGSEAKPYDDLDKDVSTWCKQSNNAVWHGTFGHHYLTWGLLVQRAQYYFCKFSSDYRGYDYLSFCGGYIWLPYLYAPYMFWLDPCIIDPQEKVMNFSLYNKDSSWFHPGIFMNRKGARFIPPSYQTYTHHLYKRLRVPRPPTWEGVYTIPAATQYILTHWAWTTVTTNTAFFDGACNQSGQTSTCEAVPWFMKGHTPTGEFKKKLETWKTNTNSGAENLDCYGDPRSWWVNRRKYDDKTSTTCNEDNWGPFLPSKGTGTGVTKQYDSISFWFRYRFKFKVSGDSIYTRIPSRTATEVISEAPGPKPKIQARSILKTRPPDLGDILAGDLDEDGILTDEGLERIIRSHPGRQPAGVEADPDQLQQRRVRLRHDPGVRKRRLRRLLSGLGLGRRTQVRGEAPP
ncbi:ORF1 [Seal anellovirus 7]|uniref:ORF1 n=1 Tax=Seal anellovirus 7 TaxID=1566009 RepID=A0A0A7TWL7_9VIRU|nr:ORF1 [Seal anellovirus 7]